MKRRTAKIMLATMLSVLMLGALASAALAKGGSVKVDDDNTCSESSREANDLSTFDASAAGPYVWLNTSQPLGATYIYKIFDKGQQVTSGDLFFTACGGTYASWYYAEFTPPAASTPPKSYTLAVYNGSAKVSADSFKR